jgi:hypothetical protein
MCKHGIIDDDGRKVCLYCGFVAFDPARSLGAQMIDAGTLLKSHEVTGTPRIGRAPILSAPEGMTARIMAAIRTEAAR